MLLSLQAMGFLHEGDSNFEDVAHHLSLRPPGHSSEPADPLASHLVGEDLQRCRVVLLLECHGHPIIETRLHSQSYPRSLSVMSNKIIDSASLMNQHLWSLETFGPGYRPGVLKHIEKELVEVAGATHDITEWVDIIILTLDGAMRSGHGPQQIIDAYHAKMLANSQRSWPDWRDFSIDEPIEHVRTWEISDDDLPGAWSNADFTGGLDEVRGPDWQPTP